MSAEPFSRVSSPTGGDYLARMVLRLEVVAPPAAQGNHRVGFRGDGRAFLYEQSSAHLRAWREEVSTLAGAAWRRRGNRAPLAGPVMLVLTFGVARPKRPKHGVYPITRPDLSKLARAVEDALTGIAYADDSQVVEGVYAKAFGLPGVRLEVWELQ